MGKNKTFYIILGAILIVIIGGVSFLVRIASEENNMPGKYDDFARCLKDKGIIMYGADWCPHCQNEKAAFGNSFKYVNYVECPADPKRCQAAGINGYPTWVFPDGKRLEGEQGLDKLSKESGCALQ